MSERKVHMMVVARRTTAVLVPWIRQNVAAGAQIESDCWRSYHTLRRWFRHATVNHTLSFKTSCGVNTNRIEGCWGLFRQKMTKHHGLSRRIHLTDYVNEFCYRHV
jgi:hypothetical protein